jgi:hypothetical protein
MTDHRDLEHLLASPYDSEGEPETSSGARLLRWLAPVLAVVVGAGVAYALTSSPEDLAEVDTSGPSEPTTTVAGSEVEYVRSRSFPPGFTPVSETIAFSPVAMYEIEGRTYVAVGVAVRGDVDPLSEPFRSVARWELKSPDGQHEMVGQVVDSASPALLQVAFDGVVEPSGAVLSAHLMTSESSVTVMIDDDAPQEQVIDVPFEIDADGTPIVIERLNYNDDWGYVSWSGSEETPATVEIVVSYLGTEGWNSENDLPARVITFGSTEVFLGIDGDIDIPQWAFGAQNRMDRDFFRIDQDLIERITLEAIMRITLEAIISLALEEADPIDFPLDHLADS